MWERIPVNRWGTKLQSPLSFWTVTVFWLGSFPLQQTVNRHSCCTWGREKPQEVWQHERVSPQFNFWRTRRKLCIIGTCFLTKQQSTVKVTVPCWKTKLTFIDTNVFQQDCAPCHCALNVRRLFNDVFTDKWIAIGGPIAWPARSPNLTPLAYQYTMLLLAEMSKSQLFHRSLSYLVYLPTAPPNLQASLHFLTFAACPFPTHNF